MVVRKYVKRGCCELMLRETGGWACTIRSVGASTERTISPVWCLATSSESRATVSKNHIIGGKKFRGDRTEKVTESHHKFGRV